MAKADGQDRTRHETTRPDWTGLDYIPTGTLPYSKQRGYAVPCRASAQRPAGAVDQLSGSHAGRHAMDRLGLGAHSVCCPMHSARALQPPEVGWCFDASASRGSLSNEKSKMTSSDRSTAAPKEMEGWPCPGRDGMSRWSSSRRPR